MKNLQSLGSLSSLGNPSGAGVGYLLYDQFITSLSAGAINATNAEPVGGARTVIDTGNRFTIANGALTVATGGGTGDPGLWYPTITRIPGRFIMGQVNFSSTKNIVIGFSSVASGNPDQAGIFFRNTGSSINTHNSVDTGFAITTATIYHGCVVLKSTGYYIFAKGGTLTNWTLLYLSPTLNTATLYPAVVANGGIGTADNVRIPATTWLPTPSAYDTFTRADGVLGSSETVGSDAQAVAALAWAATLGTWAIATNKAACSATSGGSGFATVDSGKADILIEAGVTRAAGVGGIVLRYADSSNYIIAYHDGTNAKLDKVIAGVTTNILTAVATYSAGATVRVICSGSSFWLYYNNVKIGATGTIADAAVQSTTVHGLYTTSTSNSLDNFLIMPRGTSNEYGALDRY